MEYNTIPQVSSSSTSSSISSSSLSSISSSTSNSISCTQSSTSSSSSSSSLSIAAAAATSSNKITNSSTSPNSHTNNLTTIGGGAIATPITTINNNTNGNDVTANGGGGGGGGGGGNGGSNIVISNGNIHSNSAICCKCDEPIKHRYLLRALDLFWHEDCLKCDCCGCRLGEVGSTLYTKSNLILCKRDYLRIYGTSGYCAACNKTIPAFEMVMRAKTNVYHLECFACQQCNHRFCVGDQFYLCDNKILCVYDYEERLVFASMPCNPTNLAHIRRQVSSLQPVGDSGLNNCGNLDVQNGNRNIQLPIHTRESPMYINEKFPILIEQQQQQQHHNQLQHHQLQQQQHHHHQQHLHHQRQESHQQPQSQQQPHQSQQSQPQLQPQQPSNIGHQHRDDGSSGYGSPDSETLETSPQTQ